MVQIVQIIDAMAAGEMGSTTAGLSEPRKIVLAGYRLKDWREHLELVNSVYINTERYGL